MTEKLHGDFPEAFDTVLGPGIPTRHVAADSGFPGATKTLSEMMRSCEKQILAQALIAHGHNRTHTADALQMSRRTLLNKIVKYDLRTRAQVAEAAHAELSIEQAATTLLTHLEEPRRTRVHGALAVHGVSAPGFVSSRRPDDV